MTDRQDSRFLVVIHDVAWPFSEELRTIVGIVRNLVGSQFAGGIVPMWHSKDARAKQQRILELISDCDEYLLHGWTHQCVRRTGLVSWLTRGSDEFTGLARSEIQQRIDFGRQAISDLTGTTVAGLLPPAWQLPVAARELSGLSYVMRFARLESCLDPPAVRSLATWSFDWGRLKPAGSCGDLMGTARWSMRRHAIPCVALHPADVARGWLPRATRIIEHLLDRGLQPSVPREVLFAASGADVNSPGRHWGEER